MYYYKINIVSSTSKTKHFENEKKSTAANTYTDISIGRGISIHFATNFNCEQDNCRHLSCELLTI